MDLLKQLETKLQTLVQQRNQLRDEVAQVKASQEEELQTLRRRLEDMESQQSDMVRERESTKKQVESILKMVEGLE
jgi:predicted  nucleic acid-binding Zn-ribbon protein